MPSPMTKGHLNEKRSVQVFSNTNSSSSGGMPTFANIGVSRLSNITNPVTKIGANSRTDEFNSRKGNNSNRSSTNRISPDKKLQFITRLSKFDDVIAANNNSNNNNSNTLQVK